MIGREFTKVLRLPQGRHETIKNRFELSDHGLVEHVRLWTSDTTSPPPALTDWQVSLPRS
jgi:hypothetical protein